MTRNEYCKGCRIVRGYLDDSGRAMFTSNWRKDPTFYQGDIKDCNLRTIRQDEMVCEPGEKAERDEDRIKQVQIFESNITRYGLRAEKWSHNGKAYHYHLRDITGFDPSRRRELFNHVTKLLCVDGFDPSLNADAKLIAIEDVPHWKHGTVKRHITTINPEGRNDFSKFKIPEPEYNIDLIPFQDVFVDKLVDRLTKKRYPEGERQMVLIKNLIIGLRNKQTPQDAQQSILKHIADVQGMEMSSMQGWSQMTEFNIYELNAYFLKHDGIELYDIPDILLGELRKEPSNADILAELLFKMCSLDEIRRMQYDKMICSILDVSKTEYNALKKEILKRKPEHYRLAEELERKRNYIALGERTLFVYDQGVYRTDGDVYMLQDVELLNQGKNTTNKVKETRAALIRRNMSPGLDVFNVNTGSHICVLNGVLNMDDGTLIPHTPDIIFFNKLNTAYDPDAPTDKVYQYFRGLVVEDEVVLMEELMGWFLMPQYTPQAFFALLGEGENGKSKFLNVCTEFLGRDNCAFQGVKDLTNNRFATSAIAGKLAIFNQEEDADTLSKSAMLKKITGDDDLSAEKKYGDFFTFRNRAKLVFATNQIPQTSDDSQGFYKRFTIVDFVFDYMGKDKDKADSDIIKYMLTDEGKSALLNVALKGYRRLKKNSKFSREFDPELIKNRMTVWDDFICTRLTKSKDNFLATTEILDEFLGYCEQRGIPAPFQSAKMVYGQLKSKRPYIGREQRMIDGIRSRGITGLRWVKPGEMTTDDMSDISLVERMEQWES